MNLSQQDIVINAKAELCFEVVAAAGRRLEKRSDTEWLVEFTTAAGGREIRTVELLTLERPSAIHYDWIEGPLSEVKETIRFTPVEADRTKLLYTGTFRVGRGPLGWLIGRLRVKPLYDRAVKEHLAQAKEIAETRAARTNIHGPSGTAGRGDRDE